MSGNGTDDETAIVEDFPIYVLSFGYSFLAALIIAHLLFRWHWRRRKLSRFRSSQPGDKSFRNKHMRERLKRDFAFIESLCTNPQLIYKDHAPQEFGDCAEGSDVPVHWYRMMAVDAAANFVSAHISPKRPTPSHTDTSPKSHPHTLTTLPELLQTLELPTHRNLLENLSGLYKDARFNNGEFGKTKLQLFQESLQQLKEILSTNEGAAAVTPSSLPSFSSPGHLQDAYRQTTYSSQEPLLRMSSTETALAVSVHDETISLEKASTKHALQQDPAPPRPSQTHLHHTPTSLGSGSRKKQSSLSKAKTTAPSDSELSPLVTAQMSPSSLPRSPIDTPSSLQDEIPLTFKTSETVV